ncbi:MAG: hypothetical protein WBA11_12360, partial [Rubrivirga sp.]
RRVLHLGDAFRIDGLDPETRVARRGSTFSIRGGDLSGLEVGGIPLGEIATLSRDDLEAVLDSVRARPGAVRVRALEGDAQARLDSLGVDPAVLDSIARDALNSLGEGRVTTRGFFVRIDSTDAP